MMEENKIKNKKDVDFSCFPPAGRQRKVISGYAYSLNKLSGAATVLAQSRHAPWVSFSRYGLKNK